MKDYDIEKDIPKKIREEVLPEWLEKLYRAAFMIQMPLAIEWAKAQAMYDMRFSNQDLYMNRTVDRTSSYGGDKMDLDDLESMMYDPLSSRMVDTLAAHLRRVAIPVNREIFRIQYNYHSTLSDKYPFMVYLLEQAFENFGPRAFQKANIISKLIKGQKQAIIKSQTVLNLDYDKTLGLIDAKPIRMEHFALYPPKEEISKCCLVVKTHIPESDLRIRFDIPDDELDKLKPQKDIVFDGIDSNVFNPTPITQSIPFGHVAVWIYFIPYYRDYLKEDETGKPQTFELRNALIMMGVNEVAAGKDKKDQTIKKTLLKVVELDSQEECPILFSTLTAPEVGSPYCGNVLLKIRGHQTTLNQLDFAFNRAVPMYIDPIKKVVSDGKQTSEDYEVGPGGILFCNNPNDIVFEKVQANLEHYIMGKDHTERNATKCFGISEMIEGVQRTKGGDKTATESEEERKSGEVRIDYIAEWQNDNYYQQFIFKYLLLTQVYIEEEINASKVVWEEYEGSDEVDQTVSFWDWVKGKKPITLQGKTINNPAPLYRNFMLFSGIENLLKDKFQELNPGIPNDQLAMQLQQNSISNLMFNDTEGDELLYQAIIQRFGFSDILVETSTGEITKLTQRDNFTSAMNILNGLDTPGAPPAPGMPATPSRLGQEGLKLSSTEIVRLTEKLYALPNNKLVIPMQLGGLEPQAQMQALPQGAPQEQGVPQSQGPTDDARNQEIPQPEVEQPTTAQTGV